MSEKKKILAVDNNGMMLRQIKFMIDDIYDVSFATSGEQALINMAAYDYDLILLDYEMPGMSGPEVFRKIQEDPKYSETPVVFLTGVSDSERAIEVLKHKPAGYLLKPIDGELLRRTLEELLA